MAWERHNVRLKDFLKAVLDGVYAFIAVAIIVMAVMYIRSFLNA